MSGELMRQPDIGYRYGGSELSYPIDRLSEQQLISGLVMQRRRAADLGRIDLLLAAKGTIAAGLIGETIQTEAAQDPDPVLPLTGWVEAVATAPVDWKAVALASGAFAVSSAAQRINRWNNTGRDIRRAIDASQEAEAFTTHTRRSWRMFNLRQRAKEVFVTGAAVAAGYKLGEKLPVEADLAAGIGLSALAWISTGVTRLKASR